MGIGSQHLAYGLAAIGRCQKGRRIVVKAGMDAADAVLSSGLPCRAAIGDGMEVQIGLDIGQAGRSGHGQERIVPFPGQVELGFRFIILLDLAVNVPAPAHQLLTGCQTGPVAVRSHGHPGTEGFLPGLFISGARRIGKDRKSCCHAKKARENSFVTRSEHRLSPFQPIRARRTKWKRLPGSDGVILQNRESASAPVPIRLCASCP